MHANSFRRHELTADTCRFGDNVLRDRLAAERYNPRGPAIAVSKDGRSKNRLRKLGRPPPSPSRHRETRKLVRQDRRIVLNRPGALPLRPQNTGGPRRRRAALDDARTLRTIYGTASRRSSYKIRFSRPTTCQGSGFAYPEEPEPEPCKPGKSNRSPSPMFQREPSESSLL